MQPIIGPIQDVASAVLKSHPEYLRFRRGALSRVEFGAFLDRIADKLIATGLPAVDVHFAKRYPRSEVQFVHDVLEDLVERDLLPHSSYNLNLCNALLADMRTNHYHGPFHTYIYPEEARLLFAITDIVKPRRTVFLGSYYGYWAHVALALHQVNGGCATLVDPDETAQEVAIQNLIRSGFEHSAKIVVQRGEEYLDSIDQIFDFVVLDAENPRTHPDPEQRGKSVYASLLRHALPHISSGTYLVCHNILFQDICKSEVFDKIIARNKLELIDFLNIVRIEFPGFTEYTSTEGVGVGRRR